MTNERDFSILFPNTDSTEFRQLSETACHDLGLDTIIRRLSADPKEQRLIMNIASNITADPRTAFYRQKVFADILHLPDFRKRMTELFEKAESIRNFGFMHRDSDERLGLWHLMHRLEELSDYIKCVEEIRDCLSDADISSEGLLGFREHINTLYNESFFDEMKRDISEVKIKTTEIRSVTLGINVNERFEAVSMGLVSVNSKPFKKSSIISSFSDAVMSKDRLHKDAEWNGDMHYHPVEQDNSSRVTSVMEKTAALNVAAANPLLDIRTKTTIVNMPEGDGMKNSTVYLENLLNKMLDSIVKKLRDTLTKYANVAVVNISKLIPEFIYYIRFAEFIENAMKDGFPFCEPELIEDGDASMSARGFYNLKLAVSIADKNDIVYNDLDFDRDRTIYILTGANRGGKTTVTQAVGLMFVLAQGGIYVPASRFSYRPADCIYTHFPADEDRTMDLGRLGEECIRFKELYRGCTKDSLLLMNETFSTTSFEEGYYIARDAVRALLKKQVRTIYNTHMHKLAADTDELNKESCGARVSSLIVKSDGGKRSFKIEAAPPEGMSYAMDIAKKYGVTYEMLISDENNSI